MKDVFALGLASVALVATLAGCSSAGHNEHAGQSTESAATSAPAAGSETTAAAEAPNTSGVEAAQPGTGHVTLDNAELGPSAQVSCKTEAGMVTITVESAPQTTLIVTDEANPAVRSITIGELGSGGPSVVYVDGVSGTAKATRNGGTFTVSGTGTGAHADAPDKPVDLPFEIAATCP